jgi:TPR repeat protein
VAGIVAADHKNQNRALGENIMTMRQLPILLVFLLSAPSFADTGLHKEQAFFENSVNDPVKLGLAELSRGDFSAARADFLPAAEHANPVAQYWMGHMEEHGLGSKQRSGIKAAYWYRTAARQGYTLAEQALGEMYFSGLAVPQDYVQARKWFTRAAHDGYATAQYDLGRLWEKGWGGRKSLIRAYVWDDLAASHGNFDAQRARDAIRDKLTPDQLNEAQSLAVLTEGKWTATR